MRPRTAFPLRPHVRNTLVLLSALTVLLLGLLYSSRSPALATGVTKPPDYASPLPSPATSVSANITVDTTWRLVDSPVQVTTDVTVVGPATLTIEPGVVVRFQQLASLTVDATGRLVANGTASQPITLTGTTQQPGWWDGLSIVGTFASPNNSGAALNYVTIQYGAAYGNLYVEYAVVTMTNSSVGNSSADGVYGWYGGVAHITNTTFTGNQGYAVHFIDGSVNPVLERLEATGNGGDGVAIGDGALTGRHVWEKAGLPYILTNGATVAGGAILTVEPGVEVQFQQNTGLTVNGKLAAVGTPTEPITFTGTTRQPGWWDGLSIVGWLDDPAAASISYVTIEYGATWGNLYIQEAQAAVSHSTIRYSSADGVYVWYGASGSTIASSQIVSNAGFAVRNVDTERTVLAANNWWGSNTGPVTIDNSACNPGGSGATVSGGVAFAPFLTVPGATPDPLSHGETRILSLTP
ncbi:MAG: right-handed parallel beta-helix repeat-containing protein, partial [Dehalococcoidia bacterium]|nr:right-handed parallel beta-helix repeat-containing protein [Dehalococcoidia bacterium]